MAKTTVTDVLKDERNAVDQWRWDVALRLGCDPGLAHLIVTHTEVDLHTFEDLVTGRGGRERCPPELAYHILRD